MQRIQAGAFIVHHSSFIFLLLVSIFYFLSWPLLLRSSPGKRLEDLDRFGGDFFAQDALKYRAVDRLDLGHGVSGQQQVHSALVAQYPSSTPAVADRSGARFQAG